MNRQAINGNHCFPAAWEKKKETVFHGDALIRVARMFDQPNDFRSPRWNYHQPRRPIERDRRRWSIILWTISRAGISLDRATPGTRWRGINSLDYWESLENSNGSGNIHGTVSHVGLLSMRLAEFGTRTVDRLCIRARRPRHNDRTNLVRFRKVV